MNRLLVAATIALFGFGAPAAADDVGFGTVTLSSGSATQLGRLSRDGFQSDWSTQKAFPGVINAGTGYAYQTVAFAFAPNATHDVYYEISIDDESPYTFVSAYNGAYDPLNKALNYLGDAGSSGNYFPGDPRFFDILVPAGGSLVLNFNQTTAGFFSSPSYFVGAYSNTEYEGFGAVPEPASWGLMLAGFGLVGVTLRRRGRAVAA